jgi:hypothetical protein
MIEHRWGICCKLPLISTLIFRKREFYCCKCGKTYEFFGEQESELTNSTEHGTPSLRHVQLSKLLRELEAKFMDASANCIPLFSKLSNCEKCKTDSDHWLHITPEEAAESNAAYDKLRKGIL